MRRKNVQPFCSYPNQSPIGYNERTLWYQNKIQIQIKKQKCVLLLVVDFAVEFPVSEVAGRGERLLTHGALQALLVPGRVVDPHQKAVGDGPLTALTRGLMVTLGSWNRNQIKKDK